MQVAENVQGDLARGLMQCRAAVEAGQIAAGRELATWVIQCAQRAGDARAEAEALYRLGTCDYAQADFPEARGRLEGAVSRFAELDDAHGLTRALSVLAVVEGSLCNHEGALDAAYRAREACVRIDDPIVRCAVATNLALVHCESSAFDEAQDCLEEGAELAKAAQSSHLVFTAGVNALHLAVRRALYNQDIKGMPLDTAALGRVLLKFEEMMGSPDYEDAGALSICKALANVALAQALLGQSQAALASVAQAAEAWRGVDNHLLSYFCALATAKASLRLGDAPAAAGAAEQAVRLGGRMGNPQLLAIARRVLADVHESAGHYKEALAEQQAFVRDLQAEMERRMTHVARTHAWRQELAQKDAAVNSLAKETKRLVVERDSLAALSVTDPLTGLKNRRFVEAYLASQLERVRREGLELAVAVIDVDRLKWINDSFSHRIGDAVLVGIARAMQSCLRQTDVAARLAGDEFIVLMPGTNAGAAEALKRRIKESVSSQNWHNIAAGLTNVSVSVGVAQAQADASLETLIEGADLKMYSDKRATRH